jgi:hypothetical protein
MFRRFSKTVQHTNLDYDCPVIHTHPAWPRGVAAECREGLNPRDNQSVNHLNIQKQKKTKNIMGKRMPCKYMISLRHALFIP